MILNDFLPVNKADLLKLEWDYLDFILVSGDAYVDHPSFGPVVIARVLLDAGYRVGIIAQPDWNDPNSIDILGEPRLGFLVSAGNMDSMVNHYYVSRRHRETDNYSEGGAMGKRPDRATLVYTNLIRKKYKDKPIILGGIEASLRRFAHYDYWDDSVRRSILFDSAADLLIYGMGENQVVEIAEYLNNGIEVQYIQHIPGTCYLTKSLENLDQYIEIPSFESVKNDKIQYAQAFKVQYDEQDPIRGKTIVQRHSETYLVQNPPTMPLERARLDWVFKLGYMRNYHPMYEAGGGIPAIKEVKMGIISERGCFGNCSFCALAFHQGRIITSRSHESIIEEAKMIQMDVDYKGYINDVGGPTANFRHPACKKQLKVGTCKHRQCLHPEPCEHLDTDHSDYVELLKKLRHLEGIKKVFIRSGIRYDYLMHDQEDAFFYDLCQYHVSGQLKVAPEHIDETVLDYMGKPSGKLYGQFVKKFDQINKELQKEQYIIPYLMSSHPGSTIHSAIKLAEYLRDINYTPEQVQDFYPTPGTMSTCMYYTEIDPRTMKPVFVPKSNKEKAMQRALLQYKNPRNYDLVYEALILAGRQDLIGFHVKALIKPRTNVPKAGGSKKSKSSKRKTPSSKTSINSIEKTKKRR
ncbi:YgiQ family radical SAM protein [Fusibacter ferrireducens]|uniref:YgiQ family radical SAM protein n=1 Tax=Fusibacter ferrireducens TaxID=2785058 RepID=A0ABR9ZY62_9FIRM|nr:YgiQ family radical SAM protein [Fusibacter ferrireducens]MBF4694815.1 YgiQ family radical SAM protein [Fusibacter ferrireducens]